MNIRERLPKLPRRADGAYLFSVPVKFIRFVLCVAIYLGAYFGYVAMRERNMFELPRDMIVAMWAHRMAGDIVPPNNGMKIDYVPGGRSSVYGQLVNSAWVAEQSRMITPFMYYEGLHESGIYPEWLMWLPYPARKSFHIGGQASSTFQMIALNERMLLRNPADARQILGILVHESVHVQGGNFTNGPSAMIESATSAATLEVLAGMCLFDDPLACKAFWFEVEDLADASVRTNLQYNNMMGFYNWWSDLFLRDDALQKRYEKSQRYWASDMDYLNEIIWKYGRAPWMNHVLPGLQGKLLDTGNAEWVEIGPGQYVGIGLGMPFDDTRVLLGRLYDVIMFFEVTLKGGA